MTIHRATCTDCPWSFEDPDFAEVSDELERHSQKENHHVDFQRAVATDGGGVSTEASSVVFDRWIGKAGENIDKWGLQDEETLLLAIQEELGELTQAVLEARAEGGDPDRIDEELDDLGALLLQFHERRKRRSLSTDTDHDLVTDGGGERWRRASVDAVQTHAGVGDQDTSCVNGTPGCPGPNARSSELPCSKYFWGGDDA